MPISTCTLGQDSTHRETAAHGSLAFPVACYEDNLNIMFVPMHWHDELEYIRVTSGCALVRAGTAALTLPAGSAVLINAGVLHSVTDTGGGADILHSVVFRPELVAGAEHSVFRQKLIQPVYRKPELPYILLDGTEPWHGDVIDSMEQAWEAMRLGEDGYEIEMRYRISRALGTLCSRLGTVTPQPEQDSTVIRRMMLLTSYIEQHLAEPITNGMLAEYVSCSESVLLRSFRRTIGTSPNNYLLRCRLDRAASLLLSTDDKCGDIAAACGFNDFSYFTRMFRRWTGMTPTQYRAENSGQDQ